MVTSSANAATRADATAVSAGTGRGAMTLHKMWLRGAVAIWMFVSACLVVSILGVSCLFAETRFLMNRKSTDIRTNSAASDSKGGFTPTR